MAHLANCVHAEVKYAYERMGSGQLNQVENLALKAGKEQVEEMTSPTTIKKRTAGISLILLVVLLTACSSHTNAGKSSTEDPVVAARQSYEGTLQNLDGSKQQLSSACAKAEEKLGVLTEDDVADASVLSHLRTALEHAKTFDTETSDESNSAVDLNATIDEINQKNQEALAKAEEMNKERSELEDCIAQVESSVNTRDNQYENMNMYDLARDMGYEVEELAINRYNNNYCLSFAYGGNVSFLLLPLSNDEADDIFFYGEKMTEQRLSAFVTSFFMTSFEDGSHVSRDQDGHWLFTGEQKKELCRLLSGFKNNGPSSLLNRLTVLDENKLTTEMRQLSEAAGLKFAYRKLKQKINNRDVYMIMTSNGDKVAYFWAIYSNADFRPSEDSTELGTYADGKYDASSPIFVRTFSKYHYPTDYINGSGDLVSDHGRVVELGEFYGVNMDGIGSSEETSGNQ